MWAGCIWVPIYEVMTRKHLTMVTLEENLEMAADIGMDATTSLDDAFAAAMRAHGPRREGDRAAVRALPAAAQRDPHDGRADARRRPVPHAGTTIRGSTTIVEILQLFPNGEAAELMSQARLAVRALRRRVPRAADAGGEAPRERSARGADAFRALAAGDLSDEPDRVQRGTKVAS